MKKKLLTGLATGLFLLGVVGMANASLTTIGTAQFGGTGTAYNLIWDNDNNGNSVVWLDYSKAATNWTAQDAWAANLNDSTLTINLQGYNVTWDESAWRLPSAGENPLGGYGQTTPEMGHLLYTEFGYVDGSPSITSEALNATNFDNLVSNYYWSTEYSANNAWVFGMNSGLHNVDPKSSASHFAIALRSGQVSAVPVPGAIWLFGSGLIGLVGFARRKKA